METVAGEVAATEGVVVAEEAQVVPTEEVTLPSDEVAFEMPEKFAGKSAEDIARSYLELEKMRNTPQEETPPTPNKAEETQFTEEELNGFRQAVEVDGKLSEEQIDSLEKAGYDRQEIQDRLEFRQYQMDKELNSVLEPLGGGQEKFKEVAVWANETKTPEELAEFNQVLASVPKVAQQAMMKSLYEDFAASGLDTGGNVLHTNSPQTTPSKGYKTQEEFFKDIGSEEYQNNESYRKAVEKKMGQSSIF